MIHPLMLAKVTLPLLFSAWWFNAAQFNATINTLMVAGALVAAWYIGVADKFRNRRREQDRLDALATAELAKIDEASRKGSLLAQNLELKKIIEDMRAESRENQEKMRKTLHDTNNVQNQMCLENQALRDDLHTAHTDTVALARVVSEANTQNALLRGELANANRLNVDLQDQLRRLDRDETHRAVQIDSAVKQMRDAAKSMSESGMHRAIDLTGLDGRSVTLTAQVTDAVAPEDTTP